MVSPVSLALIAVLAGLAILVVALAAHQVLRQATRLIPSAGTTSIHATGTGSGAAIAKPEFRPRFEDEGGEGSVDVDRPRPGFKNGKFPKKPLDAPDGPVERGQRGSNPRARARIRRV